MRRLNLYITIGLIALGALFLSSVELLYRWQVRSPLESHLATMRKHLPLYLEDLEFISKFPALKSIKQGKSDAGPFLNPKLKWSPSLAGVTTDGTPLVPVDSREQLIRFGNDWIRHGSKVDRLKADLSIFDSLDGFDFWDIEVASPIAKLTESGNFVPPSELPVPDSLDLIAACQIRLMKGARDGEGLKAMQQVRRLAELLLTTENTQLVIAGLAALDAERRAYRFYVDEQGLASTSWEPVDSNVTRRARRTIFATRGYLRTWTPEDITRKIFLGESVPLGFCAAVNEGIPFAMSLRRMLEPHWPLEQDFRSEYRLIDDIIKRGQDQCRLRYLSRLLQEGTFAPRRPGSPLLNHFPYWRKLFAMKSSVANFTGFEAYNQLSMPKTSRGQ